jgi:signal transduction histidine kinase
MSNETFSKNLSKDAGSSFAVCRAEFIDRIAHDLKTPFYGAREIFQLILSGGCGKIAPDLEPLLLLLKQTNEDQLLMTQRLLEIYRYDAGRAALHISTCDLRAVLKQVAEDIKPMAKAAEITLSIGVASDELELPLDKEAIENFFSHLLLNCMKHTKPGGQLDINVTKQPDGTLIAVTADGLGITERDLEGIFLLARQHSASQSYSPLAGLELHLCRQIVIAHGGEITIASQPDGKLKIACLLPRE